MNRAVFAIAAGLFATGILAGACKRAPDPPPPPPVQAIAPAPPTEPQPDGRWQIAPLVVNLDLDDTQKLPQLQVNTLTTPLVQTLKALPQVLAVDPTGTTFLGTNQVGMQVDLSWELADTEGKPRGMQEPAMDGSLRLAVTVHVEQARLHGRGEAAENTVRAVVPLPAERHEKLEEFLQSRLQAALEQASVQALGELWARRLDDAAVVGLLEADEEWRQVVGAREIGERKLTMHVEKIEKLAKSSRRDLALVAVATLGRLGQSRSVPVLVNALESRHLDVVDGALEALAQIPGAEAQAALETVARESTEPPIRQRAEQFLREKRR